MCVAKQQQQKFFVTALDEQTRKPQNDLIVALSKRREASCVKPEVEDEAWQVQRKYLISLSLRFLAYETTN